jgi:hypothetical protein
MKIIKKLALTLYHKLNYNRVTRTVGVFSGGMISSARVPHQTAFLEDFVYGGKEVDLLKCFLACLQYKVLLYLGELTVTDYFKDFLGESYQ